jgi:hypothetical protein
VCVRVRVCVSMYVCARVCVSMCVCVCARERVYGCLRACVRACVCICVRVGACESHIVCIRDLRLLGRRLVGVGVVVIVVAPAGLSLGFLRCFVFVIVINTTSGRLVFFITNLLALRFIATIRCRCRWGRYFAAPMLLPMSHSCGTELSSSFTALLLQ